MSGQYFWYYPRIFGYIRGIIRERGLLGLYRGFVPAAIEIVVQIGIWYYSNHVVRSAVNYLLPQEEEEVNLDDLSTNTNKIKQATKAFLVQSVSSCLIMLVSRPITVIATRAIAQHVGQETMYSSVIQSIWQIYSEEGIAGFYSGLVPAMLESIMKNLMYELVLLAFMKAVKLMPSHVLIGMLLMVVRPSITQYFSSVYSHPLALVSTLMAVNDSGLAVATVRFSDWRDCWNHLRVTENLFQGIWFDRILFQYRAHSY